MSAQDDLGLGELTDDQLVELARGLALELARRGAGPYAAAQAATEAARQQAAAHSDWSRAKRVAMMVSETFGDDWTFCAWRSDKTGERRVYLEGTLPSGRGRGGRNGRIAAKVTYSVDGNERYPPGDLDLLRIPESIPRDRIMAIVRYVATCWDERATIPVRRAIATEAVPAPAPQEYR